MPELTTPDMTLTLVAVCAYLLGAVPFGILIARGFGLGDLRKIGSGNIGATNVLRTGSKPAAAATLLLDGGKGAVAVLVARALFAEDAAQVAGLAAFLGHLFPIYLGFKGGKGVATFLGVVLALAWPVGLWAMALWLLTAIVSRYSSLSALFSAAMTPVVAFLTLRFEILFLVTLLAVLIYVRHRDNIRRIKAGTEAKIGKS